MNTKKQRIKAFIQALKQTYSYTSNNIKVVTDKERVVITSNSLLDAFHDVDVIRLVDPMGLSCYLSYNPVSRKVELHIF